MEVVSGLKPPTNTPVGELPDLGYGAERIYFFQYAEPFEKGFVEDLLERFDGYGWIRRSFGNVVGDASHYGEGGFNPTSKAIKRANVHGIPEKDAGVVSAALGPTLECPADFAIVLGKLPTVETMKFISFYGIDTLYAESMEELSRLLNPFIERNI